MISAIKSGRSPARLEYEWERQFAALNHHAVVSVTDDKGVITYINDLFCEISGYERDELLGATHGLVKSDLHPPEFYAGMWRTITRGQVWKGEVCNRRKDGRLYWVESTITPFMDEQGKPYQYVSIRTDITHVKAAQDALLKQSELQRCLTSTAQRLLAAPPDQLALAIDETLAMTATRLGADAAALYLIQGKSLRLRNSWFASPEHAEFEESMACFLSFLDQYTGSEDLPQRFFTLAGLYQTEPELSTWVGLQDALAAPLYIDGRVEGFIVYVICEQQQKWLDAECGDLIALLADMLANSVIRFRTTRDLVAVKERLRRGQMFANIGTWEGDLSTQTYFWSEQIAPLFGYPENEEPSYQKLVQAIHPEDRERFQQAVYEGLRRGNTYEIEYRVIQQNQPDRIRWLLERGTLVKDEAGVPVRMLSVVQDITRAKQDEAALIAARNEAERASRAKSEFLSSMSHELRTPMNAILGFGQLMEYDQALADEHKESVHEILKAGRHLLDLINDILDLAKVEAGRLSLSLEPVCLQDVVEECVSLVTPLARSRYIKVNLDLLPTIRVLADKTRLKQVCLNILSNAVKYNLEGGRVTIHSGIHESGMLRLTVEDTGKGISEEGLQSLFQPFNRLDAENSGIEGTGIGLTLTKRMVELMCGKIGVESQLGKGTRVWVDLPASSDAQLQGQCSDDSDEQVACSGIKTRTVLYVDDNPVNLKLVKGLLRRFNSVEVLDAHTPDMGIELAKQHKPDLILLDINMPGLNGYQVLDILKRNPVFSETPVIALTANAMPREVEKGLEAGFNRYLTKPIMAAEFIRTLQEYLLIDPDTADG